MTQKNSSRGLLLLLLGTAVFIYLKLFIPPFVPLWLGGDQDFFLANAVRMLNGEVIYRDFFQFTPPGADSVYWGLFKIFGTRAWIPNLVVMILGVALTWVITIIAMKVLRGRLVYLPGILFFTLVYDGVLTGTHHWFSTLAVMAGIAVIIEERTFMRLAAAGALFGLASFFTQTRGVAALLGVVLFLWWERSPKKKVVVPFSKAALSLCAPCVFIIAALNSDSIWKAGFAHVVDCQLRFVFRHLPSSSGYFVGLPAVPPWHNLVKLGVFISAHALMPLVYILFFFQYQRTRGKLTEPWNRLVLLSLVGCCLFLEVAPGLNYIRLYGVFAPGLIIVVWLLRGSGKFSKGIRGVFWAASLLMLVAEPWATQHSQRAYLDLPVGHTAFTDSKLYNKLRWLRRHTRSSDYVFDAGGPEIYFPLGLRNPSYVDELMTSGFTPPGQVQGVMAALERRKVQYILWSLRLDLQDVWDPYGDHLGPLRAYLHAHYHVVKTFSDWDQIWEKNP